MQMNSQAWLDEFNAAMAAMAIVPEPIEYRLHYDETGAIYMCSMQKHPENELYIVVDKETYSNYTQYHVDIVKKRLIKIDMNPGISVQLKRSNQGFKTVKHHAGLIIESDETYDSVEYYEPNS